VGANRLLEWLRELGGVVEEPDASAVERRRHRLRPADTRQRPTDHHAVQAGDNAQDLVTMTFDQAAHQPTISPTAPSALTSWFRLCRGREVALRITPLESALENPRNVEVIMRIGKWVRVYQQLLPVPRRMSMAFGLFENSELHVVPLKDVSGGQKHECELMISPVPLRSWRTVCRLSMRLHDRSHALAKATGFLREQNINILLSECCSTYQGRAHCDAICDLAQCPGFTAVSKAQRKDFEVKMNEFLAKLTRDYEKYARRTANRGAFLINTANFVQFSALTGLNDASFACVHEEAQTLHHRAGALRLPEDLARYISRECALDPPALPHYAMITGNTEQRYLRTLFLKEHQYMFRLTVHNDLPDFAGSGIGVLHQFLAQLPPGVNLLRTSNYIFDKTGDVERGRIDLVGYWNVEKLRLRTESIDECMEREFRQIIDRLLIIDTAGVKHKNALSVVKVATAARANPKVYISYSVHRDDRKLELLMSALTEHNYEPVLGTRESGNMKELRLGEKNLGRDALTLALGNIDGCVAFVSLQTKREEYSVLDADGHRRYHVPPWLVAEEVYAWSAPGDGPLVIRLKDVDIHDSTYNRNLEEVSFEEDDDASYPQAIRQLINKLNDFKGEDRFARLRNDAVRLQYRPRYAPTDV
jgi:hypothetical protein